MARELVVQALLEQAVVADAGERVAAGLVAERGGRGQQALAQEDDDAGGDEQDRDGDERLGDARSARSAVGDERDRVPRDAR